MTDNDGYGLDTKNESDNKVFDKEGHMKEPYLSDYKQLIAKEITIEEYRERIYNR